MKFFKPYRFILVIVCAILLDFTGQVVFHNIQTSAILGIKKSIFLGLVQDISKVAICMSVFRLALSYCNKYVVAVTSYLSYLSVVSLMNTLIAIRFPEMLTVSYLYLDMFIPLTVVYILYKILQDDTTRGTSTTFS